MKKKVLLLWFITLLAAPWASAYIVGEVSIQDELFNDLSLNETIALYLYNNSDSSFLFTPPKQAFGIMVNNKPFPYNNTIRIPLQCRQCNVEVSYTIKDAVKDEKNDQHLFTRLLNFPKIPQNISYLVYLPESYIIKSLDDNDPAIVPSPSGIDTDGRRIRVIWKEANPTLPKLYSLKYHGPESFNSQWQAFSSEFSEFHVWVIIIASFFIGAVIGVLLSGLIKKSPAGVSYDIIPGSLLSPDERTIIGLISKNSNKMRQKQIGMELGWSKSKVSAIMTNLEHKQIIKREKFGRNYEVEMVKQVETGSDQ